MTARLAPVPVRHPQAPPLNPMALAPAASAAAISDRDFERISQFIYKNAGIALTPAKKTLVAGRLFRRLEVVGAAT